jgi:tRNA dimethylallyltransferase
MTSGKHLIVVGGPTASGKTAWAIRLAQHFQTIILSADSRQFYREMSIGTAKPNAEERALAPHYFIDHLSVRDPYSVGDFEREALDVLARHYDTHDVAILAGGSGLYIQGLCKGLDDLPEVDARIRREVQVFYENEGLETLQAEVRRVDPQYFAAVDQQNPARLQRALAVWRASGRPYSSFRRGEAAPRAFNPVYLWLHWPREALYARIDQRVEAMLAKGLEAEARDLLPFRHLPALQTVGYQELFEYFDRGGALSDAVEAIKRNSRRYAKRQLTWMRRDGHWKHIGPEDWAPALLYIRLAMRDQLRIVELPNEHPGLAPFHPLPLGQAIAAMKNNTPLAAMWTREAGLEAHLAGPIAHTALPDAQWEALLLHEALSRLEKKFVYIKSPPRFELLLREKGFRCVKAPNNNKDLASHDNWAIFFRGRQR